MSKKLSAQALAWKIVKMTPYEIMRSGQSDRELRAEYTRMRDQAQKQMQRLINSGYRVPVRYGLEARRGFLKLSEIRDRRELAYAMSNLSEFLTAKNTSVRGAKEIQRNILDTLHRHGFTGITNKNIATFRRFMDVLRERMGGRKHFPSGDVAQFLSDEVLSDMPAWRKVTNDELMEAFNEWVLVNAV